jgi:hypothetical protein
MTVDTDTRIHDAPRIRALLTGVLLPPLAFLANLGIAYVMVPRECVSGNPLPLHLTHLVFLLLSVIGGWIGWRARGQLSSNSPEASAELGRVNLMVATALLGSVMFTLVILAQWVASLLLDPCR